MGGYMQAQHVIVDVVKESTWLKVVLACIPVILVFVLGKLFGSKRNK